MQIYDIIMLAVLVAAIVYGAWKGLAWQLASLAAIFVSYFVAMRFRQPVAERIEATPPWNVFLAMLILYLTCSAVIWLSFWLVKGAIDKVKLKDFDHQIGAILGAAKGVLMCVIITLFAVTLLDDERRKTICESKSGHYIALLLDRAHGVMPEEVHDVLHPYIHDLDKKLDPENKHGDHFTDGEPGEKVNLLELLNPDSDRTSEKPSGSGVDD